MGKRILDKRLSAKSIAEKWQPESLSQGQLLDRMLLSLWDALFLDMCGEWTRKGVSNLSAEDTVDLASWYMLGQGVGSHAIFDHICAFCGACLSSYEVGLNKNFVTPQIGRASCRERV